MNQVSFTPQASTESLLGEIADDFLARLDRGERPEIERFALDYPDLAQVIREVFPALAAMRECSPAPSAAPTSAAVIRTMHTLGDYRIVRELGRGGMGVVYEAEQLSLGRRVALKMLPFATALDPKQLQRFKNEAQAAAHLHHANIVPVHGVGCERGVHYYAMQLIEGQTLAAMIEELRSQESGIRGQGSVRVESCNRDPQGIAGPIRSAECGVPSTDHEPDSYPPTAAYAPNTRISNPQFATATTVKAALSTQHSTRQPAWFRTVANLGVQAAEALEHAHGEGVVHRDIKPANLLIDGKGNLWVTDFGLAQLHSDAGLTLTGDLVGTFRYMSPEQALAKRIIVDHRTDIYSLGVTLYELLTLRPVFDGRDRQEVLRQIAFEEPRLPRRLNKAIPAELENIILKAMEKNPADRYATAQDLADDLERFLKDEPIRAKRPSLVQWARKWARRHKPVVASVTIATAVVVAIAIVALLVSLSNISAALKDKSAALAEKSAALSEKSTALESEKQFTYLQRTALAGRELAAGNVGHAEELLEDCPANLRGWEWRFLKRQRYDGEPTPLQHSATVSRVAFSPDSRQLASVCYDGTLQIWDAQTRQKLHTLEQQMGLGGTVLVRGMAYSPDSRYLALARHDGSVRVWDASRGQPLYTLEGHKGPAWQVAFSPDSKTLASAGTDKSVRLWNMTSGAAIRVFFEHPAAVKGVAFRPDGRSVLVACEDGTVKVWDRDTGRPTFSFRGELLYPYLAWFSPDARRLAWACSDGVMSVWDTTTGRLEITKQTNTYQLRAVAFSPDGKRMALAGFDGTVRLLDAATGQEMLTIFAHPSVVACAVFSHDGHKIATGSYDQTVRIWDASPLEGDPQADRCVTLTGHKALVSDVAFGPDGRWLASSSWDGTVKLWEASASSAPGGTPRYTLRGHSGNVSGVAFSSDKRTLASGSWDKSVKLWDLQAQAGDSLAELRTISCTQRVTAIAFSPDGRLLAIGQTNGIGLYDPATGKEVAPFKSTPAPVPSLAFTPDSRHLGSAGASDPAIKFWDVPEEKMNFEIRHYSNPNASVAISPDGRLIAAPGRLQAAAGPTVKIWEALDWDAKTSENPCKERHTLSGHAGYVWNVTFSPDGRYLASGSWDSTIKVWDLKALENDPKAEPATLRGHIGSIYGLAFSPDGRRLATGSGYARHGEVKVWDASLWER